MLIAATASKIRTSVGFFAAAVASNTLNLGFRVINILPSRSPTIVLAHREMARHAKRATTYCTLIVQVRAYAKVDFPNIGAYFLAKTEIWLFVSDCVIRGCERVPLFSEMLGGSGHLCPIRTVLFTQF